MVKKLPRKLHVGARRYQVQKVKQLSGGRMGNINHRTMELKIAQQWFTTREQWETFWHEAVHGILHEMKRHDLNNERFVNAFCRRLYQALESK